MIRKITRSEEIHMFYVVSIFYSTIAKESVNLVADF